MLQKVQTFDAQNGHLPIKVVGSVVGSAIVTALVFLVASALEDDEEFAEIDEAPADEID
jgi:hypothetical protein